MTDILGLMIPILGIGLGFVAVLGGFWIKGQKMKLEMLQAQGGAEAAANRVTQAELEKLKDRVAVLEKLITDEDRRVASEISRLSSGPGARS
ncbi:MAG TPA: hypothetical protein VG942_09190 [Hyphomonadaceae bacterium]|nr:hypothetical protein [Hyphomonadaceae bacterium]